MKFRVEHTFKNISLEDYEKLYWSEEFNESLCGTVKLHRELIERNDDGKTIHRIVKVGPDRELPKAAQKVIGASRIEYTEHVDYTWGSNRGNWKTISSVMTDKVDSAGSFSFTEVPGGVKRVVDGHIKVKIFGMGGVVEKFIVADVEKSYDDAARFTQDWINKNQ